MQINESGGVEHALFALLKASQHNGSLRAHMSLVPERGAISHLINILNSKRYCMLTAIVCGDHKIALLSALS